MDGVKLADGGEIKVVTGIDDHSQWWNWVARQKIDTHLPIRHLAGLRWKALVHCSAKEEPFSPS